MILSSYGKSALDPMTIRLAFGILVGEPVRGEPVRLAKVAG
jgi:hypothetical protein